MKRKLGTMLAVLCLALAAGLCGLFGPSALADGIEMHEPKYYYIVGVRDLSSSNSTFSSCATPLKSRKSWARKTSACFPSISPRERTPPGTGKKC